MNLIQLLGKLISKNLIYLKRERERKKKRFYNFHLKIELVYQNSYL